MSLPGQGNTPTAAAGPAAARLEKAAAALQLRLGKDLWARLHEWTKSCLVTSQLFQELLEEVDAARERERERTGEPPGRQPAPLVDFSPVVLCLFKALEIEIEEKILRPFREALPPAWRDALPDSDGDWPGQELASLARFVRYGKPAPSLRVCAVLFPTLGRLRANRAGLPELLKHWMQGNLLRPDRWWRDGKLCQRLLEALDTYRNPAAHTGRLTPLAARKAAAALWGKTSHDGLIPTALRAVHEMPVAAPAGDHGPPPRSEIGNHLAVQDVVALKPSYWLVAAVDLARVHHAVALVPGDFEVARASAGDYQACRRVAGPHLLPLDTWFPAAPRWGYRIAIPSPLDGPCALLRRRTGRPLAPEEGQALAVALAEAAAALHRAGLVHGFISPYTVFRGEAGGWLLGGQALQILARRGCPVYAYPRTGAPEGKALAARLSPRADVYAIAATVCCACEARAGRNAGPVTPDDARSLFPSGGPFLAALCRSLADKPASRYPDALELLAALTGRPAGPGSSSDVPCPVMLSYSRSDSAEADRLIADLQKRGVRAWRDTEAIPGGAEWMAAIVAAIEKCKVVIFLASQHSLRSTQVPQELSLAREHGRTIVPVFLEDVKPQGAFAYMLTGKNRLEFFKNERPENLNKLMQALASAGVTPER
jgi:hypothetical protein